MPTEKQIEAGCQAFVAHLNEQGGDNAVWPHDFFESDQADFRSMVSGIISAAYANEEWLEADAELISAATEYFDDDGDLSRLDPIGTDRLLHLARVGAGMPGRWLPIERADECGQEFLAYDSHAKKMDVAHIVPLVTGPVVWAVQYDGEYGQDPDEFGYRSENITHCMALPAPPKIGNKT